MGVYDFSIVKDGRLFGININLRIDPKLKLYTAKVIMELNEVIAT